MKFPHARVALATAFMSLAVLSACSSDNRNEPSTSASNAPRSESQAPLSAQDREAQSLADAQQRAEEFVVAFWTDPKPDSSYTNRFQIVKQFVHPSSWEDFRAQHYSDEKLDRGASVEVVRTRHDTAFETSNKAVTFEIFIGYFSRDHNGDIISDDILVSNYVWMKRGPDDVWFVDTYRPWNGYSTR